jgi:chromosome segregation ATPase
LQEANSALRDQDQKRAQWIGKLDADIAALQEANSALRDQDQKRAQWIGKLDADIAGLNAQLAGFATTIREQAQAADRQRQELEQRDTRLATARAALGEDESAWLRYGRVVRLSRKIPGLLAAIDRLAALRRGWGNG